MADDVEMTPISPEEGGTVPPKVAPFTAAPSAAPAAPAAGSTIKLKPVIRKPMIHKPTIGAKPPAAVPPPAPAAAAKKATQNLKSVTGPIPVQATLKKTGIIAEGIITPAQQQAAKSKTSRISLESAIGVAPVKEGPAPLKTIRLRRPTDIKAPTPLTPAAPAPAASAPVKDMAPAEAPAAEPVAAAEPGEVAVEQKKTLKIQRPGVGIKRPTLGIKKDEPAGLEPVADLGATGSDVPEMKPLAPMDFGPAPAKAEGGVPGFVAALSLVVSIAALVVVGAIMFYLWKEGVATDGAPAGANEMQFIQM